MRAAAEPALTLEDLESGNVAAADFDHRMHVYAAWLLLERYALPQALQRFSEILVTLTRALGAADKYHETITWFFLLLIHERRRRVPNGDWRVFETRNSDLFDSRGMLQRYYSRELLDSRDARQSFLLPDRLAGQA